MKTARTMLETINHETEILKQKGAIVDKVTEALKTLTPDFEGFCVADRAMIQELKAYAESLGLGVKPSPTGDPTNFTYFLK